MFHPAAREDWVSRVRLPIHAIKTLGTELAGQVPMKEIFQLIGAVSVVTSLIMLLVVMGSAASAKLRKSH